MMISNVVVGKDCKACLGRVSAYEKGKFDAHKVLIITVPPLLELCPYNWYSNRLLFIC